MATSNDDGPISAADLGVKPPADIVIPPGSVRDDVAKTASYIHRKGPKVLEQLRDRMGKENKSTIKLLFLLENDPYHPYFVWFLEQLNEGKGRPGASKNTQTVQDNKPKGPPEPPKFRFSARMPNISAKDLEVIKLTALYTARVGENWLKELRNRESGNAQFDFLRVNHSFFQFFRALVDQYKILLEEEETVEARIEELQRNIKDRFHVLERAKQRAAYVKYVSQQKEKEEKRVEDEKKEYASIDWHDFSVIATVLFDEGDEASELPVPSSLNDLQARSLEQKAMVSISSRRLEEAMPDEMTYYNVNQQAPPPQQPIYPPPPFHPVAPPVQPSYQDYRTNEQRAHEEEQARLAQEQEHSARANAPARGAPGRVVKDYVPRAAKRGNVHMVKCPNCNQNVPADEIQEHLRIELLDPRWKQQRDKMEARYATTINTVDVANNLKRFASQRDDIYDGATGLPISVEEEARRKKAAMSYDGQPDPAKDAARLQQMQSTNVQEQIRRIQERHGGSQ